ncbi:YceI family protein [Hyphococcus lacteus]|uniref:YceI family protein n=1 Tax=Hyphococcus lacteus TaxID=3143536 RepID=A0ABV3Z1T5_9PROT
MRLLPYVIALAVVGCSADTSPVNEPKQTKVSTPEISAPAGLYKLDPSHASLVFRIDHLGFSHYTANFATFDATLNFDPQSPETMSVEATIDVSSLTLPSPPDGFLSDLLGTDWFNAVTYPEIRFQSQEITKTGPANVRVDGVMTMLGTTAPLSLDVTYIGGYAGYPPHDPNARIGFIAEGSLSRSDYGLVFGLPPEGSTMGVGDLVTFRIDGEFTGPPTEESDQNP